jgi:hypothetical protein
MPSSLLFIHSQESAMLKKIGISVAVLIVGFLVLVATRPSTWALERSATIGAPADVVYGQIADFHQWVGWSPWEKLDPAMKKTFDGAPSGPGAIYRWEGNDKVGEGRMTILGAKPNEQLDIKLEFIKPFEAASQTLFTFKPAGDGTQVTWTMNGTNNFMGKLYALFVDVDAAVGKDFEQGLAALKTVAETEAKKRATAAAANKPAETGAAPAAAPAQ